MKRRIQKILAWLLTVTFMSASFPTAFVYGDTGTEQERVISIASAEAFAEWAARCSSEKYSVGTRVVLEQDIHLDGIQIKPIPVFAGIFDGNGHRITGFYSSESASNLGLFRYIERDGIVRNLTVEGSLHPEGKRNYVGGIAGVNRGTIENCTFSGEGTALEVLGGIAGCNEAGGSITGCRNLAELTGNLKVGGITGVNQGLVQNCVNEGIVNAGKAGVEEESATTSINTTVWRDNLKTEKVNDIGGIAGHSSGEIRGCINNGPVGYSQVGYNVGGIVGRQEGLVYQCRNQAAVIGRKDVGGIVGQFEPRLTIVYDTDTLDKLETESDALKDALDSMSERLEDTSDTASGNMDRIYDLTREIKDLIRSNKDKGKEDRDRMDQEVGRQLDVIEVILDDVELDLGSREARRAVSRIRQNLNQMKQLLGDTASSGNQILDQEIIDEDGGMAVLENLEDLYQVVTELSGCAGSIASDIEVALVEGAEGVHKGVDDLRDSLDSLRTEGRELSDILRRYKDEFRQDMDTFDADLTARLDMLSNEMDTTRDDLKSGKDQVRSEKEQVEQQLDSIHQAVKDGKDSVEENIDKIREGELYEDVSAGSEELTAGMVAQCVNKGTVQSDHQAGGIVGMVGIEVDLDPENDIETVGDRSLNITRNVRATIWNCRNDGDVSVKNDYGGGILGRGNVGATTANQNYGTIILEDGDYAGGIAGSSSGLLKGNASMGAVGGGSYLGGICGWGTDVKQNIAMTRFLVSHGELIGSIAGDADREGEISGNYYVEEGLGAVDGITLMREADGLLYEELIALEQIPAEFSHITVTFVADGRVVKTVACAYGQPLPLKELPAAPEKAGCYWQWDQTDFASVRGNMKVQAVYHPWTSTIASSEEKKPMLLIEGNFHPDTELDVAEHWEEGRTIPEGYRRVRAYHCAVRTNMPGESQGPVTLRLLADDCKKTAVVGVVENQEIHLTETRWDGSYLVFAMEKPGEFVILEPVSRRKLVAAAAAAVLLLAMGGLVVIRRKRKNPAAGTEAQEGEAGNQEKDEMQKETEMQKEIEEQKETEVRKETEEPEESGASGQDGNMGVSDDGA